MPEIDWFGHHSTLHAQEFRGAVVIRRLIIFASIVKSRHIEASANDSAGEATTNFPALVCRAADTSIQI